MNTNKTILTKVLQNHMQSWSRSVPRLLSLFLLFLPFGLIAQTAEDYFHNAAKLYIGGEKKKAGEELATGLKRFPEDPQLRKLAGILAVPPPEEKQQKQPNQQNEESEKDQDKKSQGQQKKPDQNKDSQDQKQQSEQKKQEEKEKQDQQAKQSQEQKDKQQQEQKDKQQQQAQQASGQQKDKPDEKEEGDKAFAPGQMTPQQAQQLLDAQKNEEAMIPIKPTTKPTERNRPLKDW